MKRIRQMEQRSALGLIEEATQLLRLAPASVLASYYIGTLPFTLGTLYFWTDMSQGAFARERLAGAAVGLALLFCWMKAWQMVFATQLRARITGFPNEPWTLQRMTRAAAAQVLFHSTGLFLLPLALLVTLPFGWALGSYQNATALGGIEETWRSLTHRALQQAQLWPRQNHLLIAFLMLLAVLIFLNVGIACFGLPFLLKMFFGIETPVTQQPLTLFNTTFLAATMALTYLAVDPLVKAAYALRCFYGDSILSGEDLKAELRSLKGDQRSGLAMTLRIAALIGVLFAATQPATAAPVPELKAGPPSAALEQSGIVPPAELNRAINSVMARPEFSWRLPRIRAPTPKRWPRKRGRRSSAPPA